MNRVVVSISGEVREGSASLAELIADHKNTFVLEVGNPLTTLMHDLRRVHHGIHVTGSSEARTRSDRAAWIRQWLAGAEPEIFDVQVLPHRRVVLEDFPGAPRVLSDP